MMDRSQWKDVDVKTESGNHYFGKFLIKPYLSLQEKGDAARLAGLYTRGINETDSVYALLRLVAFLKFHVIETDATWWNDAGLSLEDEEPVYALTEILSEVRSSGLKKNEQKKQ